MSFTAYLINIEEKTGKSPKDFQQLAEEKGYTQNGTICLNVKATEIVNWLKQDFNLGHGHATAVYAYLKGKRE